MKKLTWVKRILSCCLLATLLVALAELSTPAGYWLLNQRPFPRDEFREQVLKRFTELDEDNPIEVLHPYVGYTLNLGLSGANNVSPLPGWTLDWPKRGDEHLWVALLGGSFAVELRNEAGVTLVESLAQASGKKVRLAGLGLGGYKQPQQLMVLSYILSLGAEFDLVLNIDGFNEIALPPVENLPKSVFPLYPRAWFFRAQQIKESVPGMVALRDLKNLRKYWARAFSTSPLFDLNSGLLIWKVGDRRLERKYNHEAVQLQAQRVNETRWEITGPTIPFPDSETLYPFLVDNWAESSWQMHVLCSGNGASYFHFLQPNQYLEGSKPMSPEEHQLAITANHPFAAPAIAGYPLLRAKGEELQKLGVNFHDLTMVFAENSDVLYRDDCCHLNRDGYELIAEKMVEVIQFNTE